MSDIAPVQPLPLGLLQPQPGFRFHPTDQELVTHYLIRKVHGLQDFIPEVHVYKHEPWELPGAKVEWYFFAVRARKYPNGLRMERATVAGFWKSTGKDRPVMHNGALVGMKKTLVFHTGHAPTGMRTDWVMHEYRLHGHHIQDIYALCRVFKKNTVAPSTHVSGDAYTDQDLMQSVVGGVDTLMEHVSDGADSDKVGAQLLTGGDTAEKESTKDVAGGAYMDSGGTEAVTIDTDKDELKSMPSGANAGKDISWMDFLRGDVYWNQFIPDGGWNSSADITH